VSHFHLTKWYLDCVSDDGTALVGYWARLGWGSLALEYAAVLFAPAGGKPTQRHALRSLTAPAVAGAECRWHCTPLHLEGRWEAQDPPVARDLLMTPAGGIRWTLHQPRAAARIWLDTGSGGREIRGLGYVEELTLTIPPWHLPFDVLLWGRFLSAEHALVWIQWERRDAPDESRQRLVLLDGGEVEGAVITAEGMHLPGGGLRFTQSRALREGPLVRTVLGAVPGLTGLLPARFRGIHESKRVSRGELWHPGGRCSSGWSIHEVVTW